MIVANEVLPQLGILSILASEDEDRRKGNVQALNSQ